MTLSIYMKMMNLKNIYILDCVTRVLQSQTERLKKGQGRSTKKLVKEC